MGDLSRGVTKVDFKNTYSVQADFEEAILVTLQNFEAVISVAEAVGILEQVKFDLLAGEYDG